MTGPRILLVEDEFLIRLAIAETLEDEGFEVVQAETGDAAHALLEAELAFGTGFDVLLTDINLPGARNGLRLAEEARAMLPGLRVIYATGRPDTMAGARMGPHDAFLPKPYGPAEVLHVLRRTLDGNGTEAK